MAGPDRQFDPVANAALAGIRANNRSLNAIQQNTPAPELPAQSQATRSLRQGVSQASTVSPFNLALGSGGPDLPGVGGGGGSADLLPSGVADSAPELPDPAGVFGGSISLEDLAPENVAAALTDNAPDLPGMGNGNSGSGGGSRGGGSDGGSSAGSGDANAPTPSRGGGSSR